MEHTKDTNASDDWRLQAVSTLAKPFRSPWTGKEYPVGTKVSLISVVRYDSNRIIDIPTPNATAMFLSISHRLYSQAKSILTNESKIKAKNNSLSFVSDRDAIDYLEAISASVVFAYTALEAFANEVIPDDYTYSVGREDKRCTETYDKTQIERSLNLDIKLDKILPIIFGVKSPKGRKAWHRYVELKRLRDRIIHLKSTDRKSSQPDDDTIWRLLVKKEIPFMVPIAKALIDYYYDPYMKPRPRWLDCYPL